MFLSSTVVVNQIYQEWLLGHNKAISRQVLDNLPVCVLYSYADKLTGWMALVLYSFINASLSLGKREVWKLPTLADHQRQRHLPFPLASAGEQRRSPAVPGSGRRRALRTDGNSWRPRSRSAVSARLAREPFRRISDWELLALSRLYMARYIGSG